MDLVDDDWMVHDDSFLKKKNLGECAVLLFICLIRTLERLNLGADPIRVHPLTFKILVVFLCHDCSTGASSVVVAIWKKIRK